VTSINVKINIDEVAREFDRQFSLALSAALRTAR